MRRHLLGIIGIVLLVLAAVLFPLVHGNDQVWPAACLRMGLVLVVLWMAWPELASLSKWLARAALVIAVVVAAFSKYAWILIPLLIGAWVLSMLSRKPKANVAVKSIRPRVSESSDREAPS
jgi:hypothetical protein